MGVNPEVSGRLLAITLDLLSIQIILTQNRRGTGQEFFTLKEMLQSKPTTILSCSLIRVWKSVSAFFVYTRTMFTNLII